MRLHAGGSEHAPGTHGLPTSQRFPPQTHSDHRPSVLAGRTRDPRSRLYPASPKLAPQPTPPAVPAPALHPSHCGARAPPGVRWALRRPRGVPSHYCRPGPRAGSEWEPGSAPRGTARVPGLCAHPPGTVWRHSENALFRAAATAPTRGGLSRKVRIPAEHGPFKAVGGLRGRRSLAYISMPRPAAGWLSRPGAARWALGTRGAGTSTPRSPPCERDARPAAPPGPGPAAAAAAARTGGPRGLRRASAPRRGSQPGGGECAAARRSGLADPSGFLDPFPGQQSRGDDGLRVGRAYRVRDQAPALSPPRALGALQPQEPAEGSGGRLDGAPCPARSGSKWGPQAGGAGVAAREKCAPRAFPGEGGRGTRAHD